MATKTLKDSALIRWLVLLVSSAIMFFNYYFYDALSPLKDLMQDNLGFTSSEYGTFMSAYSFPNVFLAMAVLGGIILDKIGIRITGFVFILFMALGSALTAYGASDYYLAGGVGYEFMSSFWTSVSPSLKMMWLGFFLFGLGAETSIVVLSKVIVKWFKGKEIALALGLNVAIGRLGTALALTLSPQLAQIEWTNAIWFGTMLLWIGLLTFIIYMLLDIKIDRQIKESIPHDPEDEFKWSDLRFLVTNKTFIIITLLCVTFYSAVFPFVKYAPDLLMNKFGMARGISGNISSILMFGTIVLTPLFGWIADYKGKSATLMYLGSFLLIIAHLMFAKTMINPIIPIFILGVAFSLVPAAMWPAVTKIVGERQIGTAYGFMFSVQNIGLWALPILIGVVLDSSNPNYQTQMTDQEFVNLQQKGYHKGTYHSTGEEIGKDKELNIKYIIHNRDCKGQILWKSIHKVQSNEEGEYELELGSHDIVEAAKFQALDLNSHELGIRIARLNNDETLIVDDTLALKNSETKYSHVYKKDGEPVAGEKFDVMISIYDWNTDEVVYQEKQAVKTEEDGTMPVDMGVGVVQQAKYEYFGFDDDGEYCAEVVTPLDYTNSMLMLSLLGVFGLFFAFLLKRDDKVSGYGLEKPNKVE